ncbi:MAG: NUDIX hydrolase [Candidatus Riflebacteria bacterium]|nr:NUDIX hydrolase [Candidatus Riflebacteria bacterium]
MVYTYQFPRPSVTLDASVLRTPQLDYPEILLIRRGHEPFVNKWALPGGFMEMEETPLAGAARELQEETGLCDLPLKPLFTCAEPNRDPRGRTVTMVFACLVRDTDRQPCGGDDAAEARWFSLKGLPEMAFDHHRVITQIELSLIWQARTSLVGRDVFHDLASVKDIKRLHNNLCSNIPADFIKIAEKKGLIKQRDGICEYVSQLPAGPDWQPMVW